MWPAGKGSDADRARVKRDGFRHAFIATFAANRLKNRKSLKYVVLKAATFLPRDLRLRVEAEIQLLKGLSAPTISRKQIEIDAVWCCVVRKQLLLGQGPLFLWADSSPQHGVDWLLSTILSISFQDVVEAMRSAHALFDSAQMFHEEHEFHKKHGCR